MKGRDSEIAPTKRKEAQGDWNSIKCTQLIELKINK